MSSAKVDNASSASTPSNSGSGASDHPAQCILCKQVRPDEEATKQCDCFYHETCLRQFVNQSQQMSCPMCARLFTKSRIVRVRQPFKKFLLTSEVCVILAGALLVLLYLLYFFLIVFTSHRLVTFSEPPPYPAAVKLFILVPGGIYVALSALSTYLCCLLLKYRYYAWSEQNFRLVM